MLRTISLSQHAKTEAFESVWNVYRVVSKAQYRFSIIPQSVCTGKTVLYSFLIETIFEVNTESK